MNQLIRLWTRQRYTEIWREVRNGACLEGEEHVFAQQLKDHPEYHHVWERASEIKDPHFTVEGANPFLHVALHTVVESQLLERDPAEVYEVHRAKLLRGEDRHEVVHEIAGELIKQLFESLQTGSPLNMDAYIEAVKQLA
ncbi:MAG: DUF1841 family protein [Armatimonadetes bacterium]|nr:DUF1841 family protein [Armatimonadota bacterium]